VQNPRIEEFACLGVKFRKACELRVISRSANIMSNFEISPMERQFSGVSLRRPFAPVSNHHCLAVRPRNRVTSSVPSSFHQSICTRSARKGSHGLAWTRAEIAAAAAGPRQARCLVVPSISHPRAPVPISCPSMVTGTFGS
jgi:hypothetical protein